MSFNLKKLSIRENHGKWKTNAGQNYYCPVCGKMLARGEMALKSHLRMHTRKEEISKEFEREIFAAVFPYTIEKINKSK